MTTGTGTGRGVAAAGYPDTVALRQWERATPSDAVTLATRTFLIGQRIEMAVLAQALGVGRATLHRWVGSRESLIGAVLVRASNVLWDAAEEQATGAGLDRALSVVRAYMTAVTEQEPLRVFARAEPQAALNVLLDVDGSLMRSLRDQARRLGDGAYPEESLDLAIRVGISLQWPSLIVGLEPDVDSAVATMRAVLLTRSPLFDTSQPT